MGVGRSQPVTMARAILVTLPCGPRGDESRIKRGRSPRPRTQKFATVRMYSFYKLTLSHRQALLSMSAADAMHSSCSFLSKSTLQPSTPRLPSSI